MIIQGTSYELPIMISGNDGKPLDISNVLQVQFVFGDLEKYYKVDGSGDVNVGVNGEFLIPLTQEETFCFKGTIKVQVRVLYVTGDVDSSIPQSLMIYDSITKKVLSVED